jgi:hypothetical protein
MHRSVLSNAIISDCCLWLAASAVPSSQAVQRQAQQRKQVRLQHWQRWQKLQPLLSQDLRLQQQQQQQQQQLVTAEGSTLACAEPALQQTAAGAEVASSLGAEQPEDEDQQLVLHDLTSAVPFAPRSFISNDGTTYAPSSSQQHRRLSVAIPNQVRHMTCTWI